MGNLININEAASYLGVKPATIYAWVHTRKIPYYKVGHLVKFRGTDLDRWLESHKVLAR